MVPLVVLSSLSLCVCVCYSASTHNPPLPPQRPQLTDESVRPSEAVRIFVKFATTDAAQKGTLSYSPL